MSGSRQLVLALSGLFCIPCALALASNSYMLIHEHITVSAGHLGLSYCGSVNHYKDIVLEADVRKVLLK